MDSSRRDRRGSRSLRLVRPRGPVVETGDRPSDRDLQACAESLAEFIEPPRGDLDLTLADCGWVANRWCELIPMQPAQRQRLLVLENPLIRLELVQDLLETGGFLR